MRDNPKINFFHLIQLTTLNLVTENINLKYCGQEFHMR